MKNNIVRVLLVLTVLTSVGCGIEQVEEGSIGIKKVWGKVDETPLKPVLYFYNPISSDVFEMDVRENKW